MITYYPSTIIIKINDGFFLQKTDYNRYNTTTNPPTPPKVVLGSNFFLPANINKIYGRRLNPFRPPNVSPNILGLYPLIDKQVSTDIFDGLIAALDDIRASRVMNDAQLQSLFGVISASFVVDLMHKANKNNNSNFIGENLLNYYYIDIKVPNDSALIVIIDTLKNLPGVDHVYVRGELSNLEPVAAEPITNIIDDFTKFTEALNGIEGKLIPIEKKIIPPPFLENISEIIPAPSEEKANLPPASDAKSFAKLSVEKTGEFEEIKANARVNQDQISKIGEIPTTETTEEANATLLTINNKINSLFNYCGIFLKDVDKKDILVNSTVKVVDFEQKWYFDNTINVSGLTGASTVYGGGVNKQTPPLQSRPVSPIPPPHGQKTLNILFGNGTSSNIDGLCKGATAKIASTWFPDVVNSSAIEEREAALVKTLVNSGIGKGDIVLLEIQLDRGTFFKFPVECESAMHAVIKAGVQAGYIIIEAAGNSNDMPGRGHNLDDITPATFSSTPSTPQTISTTTITKDNPPVDLSQNRFGTGAIMVGGRDTNFLIDNARNYGNRVDYYCFSEDSTTSSGIPFNATSLASAITTALVARFQSQALNPPPHGIRRKLTITEIKRLLESINKYPLPTPAPNDFANFLSTQGIRPGTPQLP
jgi:hypothetical protein